MRLTGDDFSQDVHAYNMLNMIYVYEGLDLFQSPDSAF